jgi:hypothetical protein
VIDVAVALSIARRSHLDAVAIGYESMSAAGMIVEGGGAAVAAVMGAEQERAQERADAAIAVFEIEAKLAKIAYGTRTLAAIPAEAGQTIGTLKIVMSELSERTVSGSFPAVANAEVEATKLNQGALEFMLGAQKIMFEELVFLGDEMLERTRTETHLFTEFVAKMAGAHSVKDIRTMCQECGQHQLDFIRRDSERLFKHGERMIATTSNLISGRTPN